MKKLLKIIKPFGIIVLYIILINVTAIFASFFKENNLLANILLILGSVLTIILIASFSKNNLKKDLIDFKKNYKKYLSSSFKYWCIGFTAMFIINYLIIIFIEGGIAPNEAANREMLDKYPLYMISTSCLLAPFIEEVMFRLNFKDLFKNELPFIIFTGLLFGAAHVISSEKLLDTIFLFSYGALGIAFSAMYYKTNNIYTSICMHMMHNTLTVLLILNMR